MGYELDELGRPKPIRAVAYCWVVYGKLGSLTSPHVFMAGRSNWVYDKEEMRFVDTEIAIVQTVPDGRIETFIKYLKEFETKVKLKLPSKLVILADVTRSREILPTLWKIVPDALPVIIVGGDKDEWNFPYRMCGRPLLLSRLQLWISDKKIVSSLPPASNDPNIWSWDAVREALSTTTGKPPKPDETVGIISDDIVKEDVVLAVAQLPWWAESEIPSIYYDDPNIVQNISRPYTQ